MKHLFEIAAAVLAVVAAGLWFWSAWGKVPDMLDTTLSGAGSVTDIIARQSRRNAWAAIAAGLSALSQVVATFSG